VTSTGVPLATSSARAMDDMGRELGKNPDLRAG
jgi:hypothetical protein